MSAPSSSSSSSETKTQSNKRVVLAYSGGLDTSCILVWLIEKGYQVIAFLADVGQTHDNVEKIKAKALKCGAEKCYVEDARHEFVTDFVFPLLRSTALYEGRYLLGTSIARPCIARHLVKIAHRENCKYISHGATGKGNDQVRFELSANALDPSLITIAPWRDPEFLTRFQGRPDLLRYAAEHNIEVEQTSKAPYSMDENLFHCSYESGILEDPSQPPPEDMFHHTRDPVKNASDIPEKIVLEYRDGDPVRVKNLDDGTEKTDPLELFIYLNELGKKHGIGRIDMVENRFVGIKSRGVYETPGGTILHLAHLDLEGICMDREVKKLRDLLAPRFAALAYDGFWYSPEMEFIQAAMSKAQELVDGEVTVQLYKGNVIIKGRSSKNSRYNQDIASMDIAGGYDPTDAQGFIRINSLRLKTHRTLLEKVSEREPKRVKGRITLEANTESKQE